MNGCEAYITCRLCLVPLRVNDAHEMVHVLNDPRIYQYIDDAPPTLTDLEVRYETQIARWDTHPIMWRNWIVRRKKTQNAVGYLQATISPEVCYLAWVINPCWQGRGYATEATRKIIKVLHTELGVQNFTSQINMNNFASQKVAEHLGMRRRHENDTNDDFWDLTVQPRTGTKLGMMPR